MKSLFCFTRFNRLTCSVLLASIKSLAYVKGRWVTPCLRWRWSFIILRYLISFNDYLSYLNSINLSLFCMVLSEGVLELSSMSISDFNKASDTEQPRSWLWKSASLRTCYLQNFKQLRFLGIWHCCYSNGNLYFCEK